MKLEKVFRKLVTGTFILDYNYTAQQLTFQTVFRKSSIDYCCCPCSYEHEFLDYITENGDIDEAIYNRVLDNLLNGKCPHVAEVPAECVTETGINPIHIAAAVGPLRAVKNYRHNYIYKRGKIFDLDPSQIAILKNKDNYVDLFEKAEVPGCRLCNSSSPLKKYLLYGTRSEGGVQNIHLRYVSIIEFCARKNNCSMLKDLLKAFTVHSPLDVARVLELTFQRNLKDIQRALLKYLEKGNQRVLEFCARSALVYDQPNVLARVLKHINQKRQMDDEEKASFSDICTVLNRQKCQEYLAMFQLSSVEHRDSTDDDFVPWMTVLVKLMDDYPDKLRDDKDTLENLLHRENIDGSPEYHHLSLINVFLKAHDKYRSRYSDRDVKYKDKLDHMLELGADIDSAEGGVTPLMRILDNRDFDYLPRFRELLEWLIYENSSTDLNPAVVSFGFKRDADMRDMYENGRRCFRFPGTYKMDAKTHALYGHDDAANYSLNFIGPLLIECGYPVSKDELEEVLDITSLHPAEREYIQQTLNIPRPLQLLCRDRIRKYCKGREVHTFVHNSRVPGFIGDFILLKPILRNITFPEHETDVIP